MSKQKLNLMTVNLGGKWLDINPIKKKRKGDNELYHQGPHHKHAVCKRCGRSYPETILNIEAVIHHHAPYECLNRKECQRAKRKRR